MSKIMRMAVDFEKDPELYKKVQKIVKKLDTDNSKFIRFALRKAVSEIENNEGPTELGVKEMSVTSSR